jgi:hypothetical protein
MGCACAHLAKKQAEAADGETDAHQTQSSADPGKKGSFRGKVHSRILFCRRIHAGNCIRSGPQVEYQRSFTLTAAQPALRLVALLRAGPDLFVSLS